MSGMISVAIRPPSSFILKTMVSPAAPRPRFPGRRQAEKESHDARTHYPSPPPSSARGGGESAGLTLTTRRRLPTRRSSVCRAGDPRPGCPSLPPRARPRGRRPRGPVFHRTGGLAARASLTPAARCRHPIAPAPDGMKKEDIIPLTRPDCCHMFFLRSIADAPETPPMTTLMSLFFNGLSARWRHLTTTDDSPVARRRRTQR